MSPPANPWLFLLACIPARIGFAYLSTQISPAYFPVMSIIGMGIALGFFYIYATGSRNTGIEVGNGKIWWDELRPIHGFLYAFFAYKMWRGQKDAYIPLIIDVAIGISAFFVHYYWT